MKRKKWEPIELRLVTSDHAAVSRSPMSVLPLLLGAANASLDRDVPILFPPEVVAADPVFEPEIRLHIDDEVPELLGGLLLEESETVVEAYAGIARVTQHQWFFNPHPAGREAAYLMPLPAGAIVDAAEIRCDGNGLETGAIPRAAAEGKNIGLSRFVLNDSGLLTWAVPALCSGEVEVTVQYVVPMVSSDGRYSLDLPSTPLQVEGLPWEHRAAPLRNITVYIDERMSITDLQSESGALDLSTCQHHNGRVAALSPSPGEPVHLSWALSGAAAMTYAPDPEHPGYLAVTIAPDVLGRLPEPAGRELLFVVDGSCSVRGGPYSMAQTTVLQTLAALTETDTFNLYPMDAGIAPLFEAAQPVSAETRQAAEDWLGTFSGGSTGVADGLRSALAAATSDDHLRYLMLLTDGHLDERPLQEALTAAPQPVRIHPIGLGPFANRALLTQLAETGRGSAIWPEPGEMPEQTVARLVSRLAPPALTDISIDWGELEVIEQLPAHVPDMQADTPLRVLARYTPGQTSPATIRIHGSLAQTPIVMDLSVPVPDASNEALAPLWAGEKINALSLRSDIDAHQVREEIVTVALEHDLATRYTALVGLDAHPLQPAPALPALLSTALTALEWSEAPPVALTRPPPRPERTLRRTRMSTVGMNLPSGESTHLIIELVDARQGQIETCYQDRLQYRPDLKGNVAVEVEVVSGRVTTARSPRTPPKISGWPTARSDASSAGSTPRRSLGRCTCRLRSQRWTDRAHFTTSPRSAARIFAISAGGRSARWMSCSVIASRPVTSRSRPPVVSRRAMASCTPRLGRRWMASRNRARLSW